MFCCYGFIPQTDAGLAAVCVLPVLSGCHEWHQTALLRSSCLCIGALAAVLLSTLQYGFSQFVVLPQSQSGVHTHTHTHTHTRVHTHKATRTPTHTVNPTAVLLCHTGGCCVIGWICSPARYRDSPLKFHFTSGSVNKPWDYSGCKSTFHHSCGSPPLSFLSLFFFPLLFFCWPQTLRV